MHTKHSRQRVEYGISTPPSAQPIPSSQITGTATIVKGRVPLSSAPTSISRSFSHLFFLLSLNLEQALLGSAVHTFHHVSTFSHLGSLTVTALAIALSP